VSIVPQIEQQLLQAAQRRANRPTVPIRASLEGMRKGALARPLMVALVVLLCLAGAALAARALIGSPAPREYPGMGNVILRNGTRLLSLRVPDPAGGPPWGMRLIFTTANPQRPGEQGLLSSSGIPHWGCVQIGRVVDGRLGALGIDGAFHDDGLFHELPIEPQGCGSVNPQGQLVGLTGGSGIETASAYQGLGGCVTEPVKRMGAMTLPTIERELAIARMEGDEQGVKGALEGLAHYRRLAPRINAQPICSSSDLRHITFGIAGPHATSVRVNVNGVRKQITVSPRDDGAYMIVQTGPASAGRRSPFGLTLGAPDKAPPPAPATPLSRQAERDPATPNPVSVIPKRGGPHTAFKLSFHALLNGGGYSYMIEAGGSRLCQSEAERATGGHGIAIGRIPIARGQTITKTLTPPRRGLCPGQYRVYVAYSNPLSGALPNYPFATAQFSVVE